MVERLLDQLKQMETREIWQQGFELKFSPGSYTDWVWSGLVLEVLDKGALFVLIDYEHTVKAGEEPGWYEAEVEWNGEKWVMRDGFPDRLNCPPPPASRAWRDPEKNSEGETNHEQWVPGLPLGPLGRGF